MSNTPEKPVKRVVGKFEIEKIGESSGAILPKELLVRLDLKVGDKLYVIEMPDGTWQLSRHDPHHKRAMEIAREVMREYHDTLAALAKS